MSRPSRYPAELRQRAVRMAAEVRPHYDSDWAATAAVARKLAIGTTETLRKWVRQAEVNVRCEHRGFSRVDTAATENAERRRANEILKSASDFFAAEIDRPQLRS